MIRFSLVAIVFATLMCSSLRAFSAAVDGTNDFTASETYVTSNPNYTGYVGADLTTLAFGIEGVAVQTGSNLNYFVAYIGNGASGTTQGIGFNSQQPNLSFEATHAFVYRLDGGYYSLASYNSPSWFFDDYTALAPNTENGTFFEAAIDLTDLGSPTSIDFAAYLLFEGAGGESSFAVFPSDAFAEQAYDPNVSTHLTITPVPEPQSIVLMLTAFVGMVAFTIRAGR